PHNMSSGCPLIIGDVLVTITSNGVDEGHINIPSPDAPSLIALDKNTGKLLWKDSSPGKNIMHGQWAPLSYAADPVPQVIVGQGDGWLRAFDPTTGRLLWQFDCNPKGAFYELGGTGTKSDFIAAPVVHEGRVYIGTGQDPEHMTGIARFWCIDLKRAVENGARRPDRDVSPDLFVQNVRVFGLRTPCTRPNPGSAEAWHYGSEDNRPFAVRDFTFGRTLSSACVVDGVVYAAELQGFLHCLDARTGKRFWTYDTKSSIWGAPYYVDGKVLLATDNGDLFVFRHDPRPETIDEDEVGPVETQKEARQVRWRKRREVEQKYLMTKIEFDSMIRSTPTVAGGVLYIATENTLYAIR
ncbi:MAG TPA: PQQ-binding-like beta-propeller repeat protein, partial [Gemmataceae bacterium]|nr:PQQ-binding-like beta-propeller repeat protein [Gemmataceae bacterium]